MTPVHDAVLAVLEGGGGLFFRMLADRVAGMLRDHDWRGLSDMAVAAAIWDLVWAGRLTNDTLAPLRTVLGTGRPVFDGVPPGRQAVPAAPGPLAGTGSGVNGGAHGPGAGQGDVGLGGLGGAGVVPGSMRMAGRSGRIGARRRGYGRPVVPTRTGPPTVTGRWSLLPDRDPDLTRRSHAIAQALLDRHGIVTRGSVVAERVPGGFGALYPVLRAMEEAGQCRRGYFVEGLGAAQFALPGAVDRMRAVASAQEAAAAGPPAETGHPRWPGQPPPTGPPPAGAAAPPTVAARPAGAARADGCCPAGGSGLAGGSLLAGGRHLGR